MAVVLVAPSDGAGLPLLHTMATTLSPKGLHHSTESKTNRRSYPRRCGYALLLATWPGHRRCRNVGEDRRPDGTQRSSVF
jgi:hypothetical protein